MKARAGLQPPQTALTRSRAAQEIRQRMEATGCRCFAGLGALLRQVYDGKTPERMLFDVSCPVHGVHDIAGSLYGAVSDEVTGQNGK